MPRARAEGAMSVAKHGRAAAVASGRNGEYP
jgi:hypothetical protein